MKFRTAKLLRARRNARKRIQTTEKLAQVLIISLILALVLLTGCENMRHSIGVSTNPLSSKFEEKTKLNYKIIFGKVRPKEDDD